MKKSKKFRALEQKVMIYMNRHIKLPKNKKTELMIDYILTIRQQKQQNEALIQKIESLL